MGYYRITDMRSGGVQKGDYDNYIILAKNAQKAIDLFESITDLDFYGYFRNPYSKSIDADFFVSGPYRSVVHAKFRHSTEAGEPVLRNILEII